MMASLMRDYANSIYYVFLFDNYVLLLSGQIKKEGETILKTRDLVMGIILKIVRMIDKLKKNL